MNVNLGSMYKSHSQIARVLTESWVKTNSYCLNCGSEPLIQFNNNKPVADFYCGTCKHEYELKSMSGKLKNKITDGAYYTMINRIQSDNNPNFFFLNYNLDSWTVHNFFTIPKHFFTLKIIEQRKPLSVSAKRAGWIGCNILLNDIPSQGKIYLIKNGYLLDKNIVLESWKKTSFLKYVDSHSKSWLVEMLRYIDLIPKSVFNLEDI